MKYRRYSEQEVIDKTRQAIHFFIKKQIDSFISLLDEDFVWVGDYEPLYMKGVTPFLQSVHDEIEEPSVKITDEEYSVIAHNHQLWVTCGRFFTQENGVLAKIHFTFVWNQKENDLILLHANANYAKKMPDTKAQSKIFETTPTQKMLKQANKQKKLIIRDIKGNIHYLSESEIMYIQSDNKLCEIHLKSTYFTARKALSDFANEPFLRIHRSYVVNPSYISSICRYTVFLDNETELPMGKESYMTLKHILQERYTI